MTEPERDEDLLQYIEESILLVEQYAQSGKAAFVDEPIVQDAILRRLETLADAAGHLSDELKRRHPEIPWRDVYGFRNWIAHGYRHIDLDRAWTTVEEALPVLKAAVEAELAEPHAHQ